MQPEIVQDRSLAQMWRELLVQLTLSHHRKQNASTYKMEMKIVQNHKNKIKIKKFTKMSRDERATAADLLEKTETDAYAVVLLNTHGKGLAFRFSIQLSSIWIEASVWIYIFICQGWWFWSRCADIDLFFFSSS